MTTHNSTDIRHRAQTAMPNTAEAKPGAPAREESGNAPPQKTNVWDFLIAATKNGQLIPAGLFLIVAIVVLKLPPADLSALSKELWNDVRSSAVLSIAVNIVMAVVWYKTAGAGRRRHEEERTQFAEQLAYWRHKAEKRDKQG